MDTRRGIATLATLLAAVSIITACRIEKNDHGDASKVKVATPFGGVQVKTNDSSVLQGLGLPIYPGAQFLQDSGKSNGSADVNLNLGVFSLRIKSAAFKSSDSPEELIAFYRKALTRYGDVIECQHGQTVGSLTHTTEGLTCEEDHSHSEGDSEKIKLLAGSKQHQHVVIIGPDGNASKLQIVAMDLPGHSSSANSNEDEANKQ
jgi:hypothetical protein